MTAQRGAAMSLPAIFDTLRLPVIGAPLFIYLLKRV